ncbi:MAG: RHS repeat domain-containing protein [Cytophaga sp.]|uniref:RHS repeat domain-containing protein n=1 Tax=Cytophaga sp. TaxID=29535 RepID=UPI003F7FB38B
MLRIRVIFISIICFLQGYLLHAQCTQATVPAGVIKDIMAATYPSTPRYLTGEIDEATGKLVCMWQEQDVVGTTRDIKCAIYDKDLNQLVAPFRVNYDTTDHQTYYDLKIHPYDNSFIITWASRKSGNYDVYLKKISLDITSGAAVTAAADVLVTNTALDQASTNVTINYARNEIIVGYNSMTTASDWDVYVRRLDYATLTTIGSEFRINTVTTATQAIWGIEYSTQADEFIVSYHSNATGNYDILCKTYKYDATTSAYIVSAAEQTVNTYLTSDQMTPFLIVNQTTGDYAISWSSNGQDGSSRGAYARVYDRLNAAKTSEILLNVTTSGDQFNPRPFWDEPTNVLGYSWAHVSGSSLIRMGLYDGNNSYAMIGGELDPLSGANVNGAGYTLSWGLVHPKSHRFYLCYDQFNGAVSSYGRIFVSNYCHPSFNPALSTSNSDMNWVDTKSFNAYGDVVSESRTFYDNRGKELQSQSFNAENPKFVFGQMSLYDYLDRPTLQTLPAVSNNTGAFVYNPYFIVSQAGAPPTAYNAANWDASGTVNNPAAVINTAGSLGTYYSANNTYETGVPNTSYPYSRTFLNDDAQGGVVKQTNPGEALRMGQGHETKSISLGVLNELDHYAMLRKTQFVVNANAPSTLKQKAGKSIVIDENGMSGLSFTDLSGNTIATAKEGTSSMPTDQKVSSSVQLTPNLYYCNFTYAGSSCNMSHLRVFGAGNVEIINVYDGAILYPMGPAAAVPEISYSGTITDLQIRSAEPFSVKMLCNPDVFPPISMDVWLKYEAVYQQGQSSIDLHLQSGHGLSGSLSNAAGATIEIQDLTSAAIVYSGAAAGYNYSGLAAGFYRIRFNGLNYQNLYNNSSLTLSYNQFYTNWAYYFYDDNGNLIAKTQPNGISSLTDYTLPKYTDTYTYTTSGQVLSSTEVDGGTTNYVYRNDGSLRFSQNADQATDGRFSFVNYDADNRTVMSGEYKTGLSSAPLSFVTQKQYDAGTTTNTVIGVLNNSQGTDNGGLVSTNYMVDYNLSSFSNSSTYTLVNGSGTSIGTRTPRNVWNIASVTTNKAGYATVYSYDNDYNLEWMVETLPGLGSKTVDYVYDDDHQLLQTIYQKNDLSDRFAHIYKYDKVGRLKTASTREASGLLKLQEKYIYYLHGALKRKELAGNLQGIDYVYTIQGWLKGINHPELNNTKDPGKDGVAATANAGFAPDVFGMSYDYYNGDYSNSSLTYLAATNILQDQLYNGTIQSTTWGTKDHLNAGNPYQYIYQYDNKYQLTWAYFGYRNVANNTNVDISANRLSVSYDRNGNITYKGTLKSATVSDDYNYGYNPATLPIQPVTTNKLFRLNTYAGDINRNYIYNAIGQMTQQTEADGKAKKVKYNGYGQVTEVRNEANLLTVLYEYNERGQKVKKTTYAPAGTANYVTCYVSVAAGNIMIIYDTKSGTLQQSEIPLYGAARIGVAYKNGSALTFTYELKDHLGNVRATINRTKKSDGTADILSWADYLPFGEVIADRHGETAGLASRFGYQGDYAECDPETKWNDFDLRMYDPSIGRWLSRDPYNQYHSPYVGMGNDPVNGVDPDGGFDSWFGAFMYNASRGFKGSIINKASAGTGEKGYNVNFITEDGRLDVRDEFGKFSVKENLDIAFNNLPARILSNAIPMLGDNITAMRFVGALIDQDQAEIKTQGIEYGIAIVGAIPVGRVAGKLIKVEQYALRAAESGFYPVLKRGCAGAQELTWLNKGDVWKFGTTKNPFTRYSQKYLDNIGEFGVYYKTEFTGTLKQATTVERMKILNFRGQNGVLPAGNKIVK